MGDTADSSTDGRGRLLALDVGIVIVLIAAVIAAGGTWRSLRMDDGSARSIAAWARQQGADRVAWPAADREAVPALLAAGVTPVLVDPDVAAQQLAVNRTPVIATTEGDRPPLAPTATFDAGAFTASMIDLDVAKTVPLEVGEHVGVEYARPYRYAPIGPSLPIQPGGPVRVDLRLASGSYDVRAEMLSTTEDASFVVGIQVEDGVLTTFDLDVGNASQKLEAIPIVIGDGADASILDVVVYVATYPTDAVPKPIGYLHSWRLDRIA